MEIWAAGEQYGSFTAMHVVEILELQCTLIELTHEKTGASVLHIANDDDENLFSLSFQTRPDSSNGAAHILEHTILCGSEHFPISDPFFSMSRRSLNTFMNALTGADFTCYPASSQIPKDFYNLLSIYLDAVFRPLLLKKSFLQEGHRLEFNEPENPSSPLEFKGIVFNEMKGAMATGEARLSEALMHALFPNVTYGVNSGGDPKEIPNLTYEELKAFHQKFYHPSRCLFFFYGNIPLKRHLDFIEKEALNVNKEPSLPSLPIQPRFEKPVIKTLRYPVVDEEASEEKTLVGMGWLTTTIQNQEEILALNAIDLALMGTDAAPLKMALLKSNLCKQADSFIENEMTQVPYFLVCKGCLDKSGPELEHLIRSSLHQIIQEGIPSHLIEGAIHQLEFSRCEITGHSAPYGLSLFFRSALLKQHGANPEDGLRIHTLFQRLRQKKMTYFIDLLQRYWLENSHFVRIDMEPDMTLAAEEAAEEKALLKTIRDSLTEEECQSIVQQSRELFRFQEERSKEDVEILPRLTLDDVPQSGKEYPLSKETSGALQIYFHPCFTNEIIYPELIFDLPHIAEDELHSLRLFATLLPNVGCGGRNYVEHLDYLLQHTGGISVTLELFPQADNPSQMHPSLAIRSKALNRKMEKLFPLLADLVVSADFTDIERLKELLAQHFHSLETSIRHGSLKYAINLAASGLSLPAKITNAWNGLNYYWKIKELTETFDQNPNALVEKMQEFQNRCLGLEGAHLVVSSDESAYRQLQASEFYGLSRIPRKPFSPWKPLYSLESIPSQGRVIASPVAFTVLVLQSVPYTHPLSPALSIASQLAENKILHTRIREQGGAYGCGAVHNPLAGNFYVYSYRDPQLCETLNAFRDAFEALASGPIEEREIEEAKLGIFQDIDSPIPPGSRAAVAYSRLRGGRTSQKRQAFRNRLFKTSTEDIRRAAEHYLLPGLEAGIIVSFASKELLEKENQLLKEGALPIYSI